MRLIAFMTLFLMPIATLAQDNPILNRMAEFVQAYNAQDAATIAKFYATDAALLPPEERALVGHDAIAAHYTRAFEAGARSLQAKTFDIRPLGESAAVEIGETVVMVGTRRVVGRYMHLWEVVDGQLLLTRDMYHILKIE